MAIVLKEQKKKFNWFALLVFLFLLLVIAGGGYYLFFGPVPAIEALIGPAQLQSTVELSRLQFDPATIIANPVLKNLRQFGPVPSVGNVGRDNPFLQF